MEVGLFQRVLKAKKKISFASLFSLPSSWLNNESSGILFNLTFAHVSSIGQDLKMVQLY